jgi:transcriptional regulator of aromatic amino acid metabolism
MIQKQEEKFLKRQEKELQRQQEIEQTVQAYRELGSLRKTAIKMNVSHISIRDRIKLYEIEKQISILKSQGK